VQQESAVRERELTLARDVQRASLPLTTPRIPGLELTVRSEQAAEVGGDFHVFVTDAEAAVAGICIGDVSGKGMAAALIATSVANVFPYLNPLSSPLSALQRLHGDLIQRLADGSFVSLFFTIIDGTDGRVRYWNAGHPPMLHWHAETGECDVLTYGDSAPLGMLTAWTTQMRRVQLQRGDILVVCSDGITESVESLDEAKILPLTVGIVQRVAPDGADAVADALVAASREHVRSSTDDLTVIVARYQGV
jgi:serine phosphatase RsbU (regulator of sigma subunit)